ncbi:SCO family protein [Gluconacetobacter azotocaptans]|uniref:SCO family protein n=1 Tax=Gluconacetobacter azotocaptans TaxID=142834 RepID=UPI00195DAA53|nr:SCO family protein [Gluconacetobacter azotocaptans]MBM9403604.1 SCO family protein [Gluconacetobacter azotocaptans]
MARGTQQDRIRAQDRRARWAIAAVAAVLLGGAALYRTVAGLLPHARIGGDYTLVDDRGRTVSQAMFRGRYTLIYFGYTHCIDVCPLTLATVTAALAELGPRQDEIVPLFISVDPARDTPAVVHRYVTSFSPRIVGLTGTEAEIGRTLAAFHALARRRLGPGQADGYLMDHSSVLYLMDGDNRLVSLFPVDSSAPDIAQRLHRLLPPARHEPGRQGA